MTLKLRLVDAEQRDFDLCRVHMESWSLIIEAVIDKNEANNRLHIIFPDQIEHYQVTYETYKAKFIYDIYNSVKDGNCEGGGGKFFEVLSIEKYSQYLQEQSDGLFLFHCGKNIKIYIFFFMDHLVEVASYAPPKFVYSYTEEWKKYNSES